MKSYFKPEPLGESKQFVQAAQHERGGMLEHLFKVEFQNRILQVWTYQIPDGKLEQYQIAPLP